MAATVTASPIALLGGLHGLQTGHTSKARSSQHCSSLFGDSLRLQKSAGVDVSVKRSQQFSVRAACGPCKSRSAVTFPHLKTAIVKLCRFVCFPSAAVVRKLLPACLSEAIILLYKAWTF